MRIIIILLISLSIQKLEAQNSFYDVVQLGDYKIGYSDSIVFNEKENYNQFGYSGAAPMFVQIWHPLKSSTSNDYMEYGDFRKRELTDELALVYDKLSKDIDESFISYNISEEFDTYKPIDYGKYSFENVLSRLKTIPTKSIRHSLNKKKEFPIIVYHHGGQGLPDENYIMAEYFASRGYIFVSANYHLPFEGLDYGASSGVNDLTSFPKELTTFAKTLTTSDKVFYIGHSWGAQVGLNYLFEKGSANGFVSLETTIEFKKDSSEIKQKWPNVYKTIKTENKKFPLPILLFANTRVDEKFNFFEDIGLKEVFHVSTKAKFGHESYTAAYLLRQLYTSFFPQPDIAIMRTQLLFYHEHLKLIDTFFNAILLGSQMNNTYAEKYFFIN